MNAKIFFSFLMLLLMGTKSLSQMLDRIGPEQGLSQNSIRCMIQDHLGKMWIGTSDGLNIYDGYDFKQIRSKAFNPSSLSSDYISCLLQDRYHRIWVGTEFDLDVFDTEGNWMFSVPVNENKQSNITHLVSVNESTLAVSTGDNIFIVYIINRDKYQIYQLKEIESNAVKAIGTDSKGHLWTITSEGVFCFSVDNSGVNLIKNICNEDLGSLSLLLSANYSTLSPINLVFDNFDNLWITGSGKLLFINTKSGLIREPEIGPNNTIYTSVHIDRNHVLWLGTASDGVKSFDVLGNGTLITCKNQNLENINLYLENTIILSMYEGDEANEDVFWIGTGEKGVFKYSRSKNVFRHHEGYFISFSKEASSYYSILKNENFLWAGIFNGLYRQDLTSNRVEQISTSHLIHKPEIFFSMCNDKDGKIWVGTNTGLYFVEKGHKLLNPYDLKFQGYTTPKIRKVFEDSKGNIWLGSNKGLFVMRSDGALKNYTEFLVSLFKPGEKFAINDIEEDKNDGYWIATTKGLIYLKGEKAKLLQYDILSPNGPLNNWLIDVFCDSKGNVWIGTVKGLSKVTVMNDGFCFDHYIENVGLPDSYIYSILEGDDHQLWLSSNNGLIRFNPLNFDVKIFKSEDGLDKEEFNSGAATKDKEGHLYFGGLGVLVSFVPSQIVPNSHLAKVQVKSIKVMDKDINIEHISENNPLHIAHDEKFLRLKLSAIDYKNPLKNQYAYRINGIHNKWINNENERMISLLNLPSGHHTLEIKAANSDGVWNEDGTIMIPILVGAPFWQQSWFIFLGSFLTVVLGYLYFKGHVNKKLRIAKIRMEENERVRKIAAQDLHDDFGNSLTRITILSRMAALKLEQDKLSDAALLLKKIAENSSRLYQGTKDFIWALNPESDNLWDTMVRIKDFAEETLPVSGLVFDAEGINDNLKKVRLRPGTNRHIMMIMKEAVSNTLKHAEATKAELKVSLVDKSLEINWYDNGKGTQGDETKGNGILNMKSRAKLNDGHLRISKLHKGTRIQLNFNL